ncbi:hypothetical protein JCGZ_22329 [Jatropha curcas]|uniref:Uncharacterized protein n=1 Tax=Jatropha curcas TaxID=180498 RepID=A0A067L5N4_JATCU|nr:uncharacterized protein LOC105628596 [Jatropha curcas]KDP43702.1 hypothetical protein JCGZ_22329 [Jatropha curcas]
MGKQQKRKSNVSNFLPKTSNFLSPPPSPVRPNTPKRLSSPSPRISLIPKEIRRRARSLSFDAREPTSPKVSCMGQVKNKNKKKTKDSAKIPENMLFLCSCRGAIVKIFKGKQQNEESNNVFDKGPPVLDTFEMKAHEGASTVGSNCLKDEKSGDEERDGEVSVEPRKQVNLWRKRALSPPRPLRV